MTEPPAYFEAIRQKAASRWSQLEGDPELAGPWRQLFAQVQSPRHVLSELLQNANDAGATEARVELTEEDFVFEHNGEDFTEEHFASLCRFGFSNKRALHTIGFRGIGFKSTFSLGDWVELQTPTLNVRFHRDRFTEPLWAEEEWNTEGLTRVRVRFGDALRRRDVERNLEEWLNSPVSLLFFSNIRRLDIGGRVLHWAPLGEGPAPDSEWMALHGKPGDKVLLIRSAAEAFPAEALEEIQQERMTSPEEGEGFPPCRVELVLGAAGRLYVVLPTGVSTPLPFACNAPFIQDPARVKIKDPETSPTNRWLLERVGKLAGSAMLQWLRNDAALRERAGAYALLPDVNREDGSLEGVCAATIEEAVDAEIGDQPVLLTEDGRLVEAEGAVVIPARLLDVWPDGQAAALLDGKGRPALCRHVESANRTKLRNWRMVEEVDRKAVLQILQSKHLPKPGSWRQLMALWAFIAPEITGWMNQSLAPHARIMPVAGRDALYSAREIVRLGEGQILESEADWDFLAPYLIALDPNWTRYLNEQRRIANEEQNKGAPKDADAACGVLEKGGLTAATNPSDVVASVARSFFAKENIYINECVRLAHIAAKLNADVSGKFRFVTLDRKIRENTQNIFFDEHGTLVDLLPPGIRDGALLHEDYTASFESCSKEEWLRWVGSGNAGLRTFAPIGQRRRSVYGRGAIEEEAQRRGVEVEYFPYVTDNFVIDDQDFDDAYWRHWNDLAVEDDQVWVKIVERILAQPQTYWITKWGACISQVATTGNTASITKVPPASWLLRLRELPCLKDTRGFTRKPTELLRRTPETEPLMDVELFVHGAVDRESVRPLLDHLGVRSAPVGPAGVLDRLRALSKAPKPPAAEVEKWCRRLDQMIETGSTEAAATIRNAFQAERIIFTQDGAWTTAAGVFLHADESDAPGAAIIRAAVQDLALWRRVGVAERPSADLAIAWLKTLPSGDVLPSDDARRVRSLLARHSRRVWDECGHWLNLAGEWAPTTELDYALTMQSLVRWQHLHPWAKKKTADFQHLPAETASAPPFSALPSLASQIEDRLRDMSLAFKPPTPCAWLASVGAELRRVKLASAHETERVRALAGKLAKIRLAETERLEVLPYIGGVPAGTPRAVDVVWADKTLHVAGLSKARRAKRIPEEVARCFEREDVKAALYYAFERAAADIRDYMAENFDLADQAADEGSMEAAEAEEAPASINGSSAIGLIEEGVAVTASVGTEGQTDEQSGELPTPERREPAGRPRAPIAQAKPPLIERFAKARGFCRVGDGRFYRDDGSWIKRNPDGPFRWELYSASSREVVTSYWDKDQTWEQRHPLELDAEIWGLIANRPGAHALLLADPSGNPIELPGAKLLAMRDANRLTLYPAAYRLVLSDDRHDQ